MNFNVSQNHLPYLTSIQLTNDNMMDLEDDNSNASDEDPPMETINIDDDENYNFQHFQDDASDDEEDHQSNNINQQILQNEQILAEDSDPEDTEDDIGERNPYFQEYPNQIPLNTELNPERQSNMDPSVVNSTVESHNFSFIR